MQEKTLGSRSNLLPFGLWMPRFSVVWFVIFKRLSSPFPMSLSDFNLSSEYVISASDLNLTFIILIYALDPHKTGLRILMMRSVQNLVSKNWLQLFPRISDG